MGLSRRLPIALTGLAAGLVLGVVVTALADPAYRATTVLQASPSPDPRLVSADARPRAAEVLAAGYAELVSSASFRAQVAPGLGLGDLDDRVRARRPEGSALVEVTADGPTRTAAEALAAGVTNAFLALVRQLEGQRSEAVRAELQRRADELTARIAAFRRRGAAESDERVVALRARRRAVDAQLADAAASGPSITLVAGPAGTAERVRPNLAENVLAGVALGLVAGAGAALLPWRRRRPKLIPEPEPEAEPEERAELPVPAEVEEPEPIPPSVTLVLPVAGTVLEGAAALVARAPDAAAVRFLVSNGSAEWTPIAEASPGTGGAEWDTYLVPDGRYWLSAVATNGAGVSAATDPVPVQVRNGP
jgi:capsular polysaccharide biosynthesis protein